MDNLEKVIIKDATNKAKDDRLIEVARGEDQVRAFCEGRAQITTHVLLPGETSGNHHHKIKEETIGIEYGKIEFYLRDIDSGNEKKVRIKPGKIIYIPARVYHSLKNLSKTQVAVFWETANLAFNPEDPGYDCHPYKLID